MKRTLRQLNADLFSKGEQFLADISTYSKDPLKANEALLMQIIHGNRNTEYGRRFGFSDISNADEYRKKVPLSSYDDYEPYIRRMVKNGEHDLITSYDVIHYAVTSGSVGVQKMIPITDRSMALYKESFFGRTIALAGRYYKQKYGQTLPAGKCLDMLETESFRAEDNTPKGSVSGAVSGKFRDMFSVMMTSPEPVQIPGNGMNMNYMKARFALEERSLVFILSAFMTNIVDMMNYIRTNWEMIVDDIQNGTINEDVCDPESRALIMPYIKKDPERAQELREVFSHGFNTPIMPRIWKDLTWVCSIGTGGFSFYSEKFRKYAGENIAVDYFAYAASEGLLGIAVNMNDPRFVPVLNSCFFEFLPADAPEDCNETLLLDELEDGAQGQRPLDGHGRKILLCFFMARLTNIVEKDAADYDRCPGQGQPAQHLAVKYGDQDRVQYGLRGIDDRCRDRICQLRSYGKQNIGQADLDRAQNENRGQNRRGKNCFPQDHRSQKNTAQKLPDHHRGQGISLFKLIEHEHARVEQSG